jgi:hypothetical protein
MLGLNEALTVALPGTHPGSEDTSHTTIVARS